MCGELANLRALIVRSTFHFFAVSLFVKPNSFRTKADWPFNSSVVGKQSDRSLVIFVAATYYLQLGRLGIMIEQILRKN